MTFKEFQATRVWHDDLGKVLRDEMLDGTPGYLYADSFYVEQMQPNGHWYLLLSNADYESDDLEELERRLWDDFAEGEVNS